MEAQQIVQEVFNNMGKMYESIFQSYYPSHKSNGFTERNLTFYFSHFYLKNALNLSDIIIWQEVPLKEGGHFDTLIVDTENRLIFIIEAKRLQNDGKLQSIEKDLNRILDCFKDFNEGKSIINIPKKYSEFKKHAILLTDIWIPINSEMKKTLQKDFTHFSTENYIAKPLGKGIKKVNNIKKYSEEKYFLMYNLFGVQTDTQNEIQNN